MGNQLSQEQKNMATELQTKIQQNETLLLQISQVEAEIEELKQQTNNMVQERMRFEHQYKVARHSFLWRASQKIRQLLNVIKVKKD